MANWILGTPDDSGFYWVKLSDQGGHQFVTLAVLRKDWKSQNLPGLDSESFSADSKRVVSKDMTVEQFNDKYLELMYCLPDIFKVPHWEKINTLWNCYQYIKIETPDT